MLALSSAELTILDWIALHCHTPWLDAVVPWITRLGDGGILWIILALVLLILPKERLVGAQAALALILHVVLCNLLVKNLVGRIRPFELAGIDQLLVALPDDPSFPSGHSAASFAVVTVLFCNKHPLRWPALIAAVLIALSRLYLYVHYPTDVLAGVLLGTLCGFLAVGLWRKLAARRAMRMEKADTQRHTES